MGVSIFSKPLALLIGLLILGVQVGDLPLNSLVFASCPFQGHGQARYLHKIANHHPQRLRTNAPSGSRVARHSSDSLQQAPIILYEYRRADGVARQCRVEGELWIGLRVGRLHELLEGRG